MRVSPRVNGGERDRFLGFHARSTRERRRAPCLPVNDQFMRQQRPNNEDELRKAMKKVRDVVSVEDSKNYM